MLLVHAPNACLYAAFVKQAEEAAQAAVRLAMKTKTALDKAGEVQKQLEAKLDRRPDLMALFTKVYEPLKEAEEALRREEVIARALLHCRRHWPGVLLFPSVVLCLAGAFRYVVHAFFLCLHILLFFRPSLQQ